MYSYMFSISRAKDYLILCALLLFQDSFETDAKNQPSREQDIEMGTRVPRSASDLGMDAFNKQVNVRCLKFC